VSLSSSGIQKFIWDSGFILWTYGDAKVSEGGNPNEYYGIPVCLLYFRPI